VIVKGGGFGLIGDIVVGVIGSLIGGWLFSLLGRISVGGLIIAAVVGAIILIVIVRLASRRRPGIAASPALELADAVALYQTGRSGQAYALAELVESATDPEAAARAAFLCGLIADEAGHRLTLQAALNRIAGVSGAEHQTDADELAARLALRNGDNQAARARAVQAADLRCDLVDYRSLARDLALAARASELTGNTSGAADFYLRAGRTAAGRGDDRSARLWLTHAVALSHDPGLTHTARSLFATLARRLMARVGSEPRRMGARPCQSIIMASTTAASTAF
jgi:uncharacterized membrane protein YeaQ/YmgE (transglycosylase-associated protein family)